MIHKLDEIKKNGNLDRRVRECIKDSLKKESLQSRDARLRLVRRINYKWRHFQLGNDGYHYVVAKRSERRERAHDCGNEATKGGVH